MLDRIGRFKRNIAEKFIISQPNIIFVASDDVLGFSKSLGYNYQIRELGKYYNIVGVADK